MRSFPVRFLFFGLLVLGIFLPTSVLAGFIDFEDGWDGSYIRSSITGLEFTSNEGWGWVYGDWRTDTYNGPYPNQDVIDTYPLATQYDSDGNFFAWMGTEEGTGIITFTAAHATFFQVGYSTWGGLKVTALDDLGLILDEQDGVATNVGTGQLDYIRVNGEGMKSVKISGVHNKWLIDNLLTDAVQQCTINEHCDDGLYCNGQETCDDYLCESGEPVTCADDGLFCNGQESCSNEAGACIHSGNPCDEGQVCDEEQKICTSSEPDDDSLGIDDDSSADDDDEESN